MREARRRSGRARTRGVPSAICGLVAALLAACGGETDMPAAEATPSESAAASAGTAASMGSVTRVPLPGGSTFPIASAVRTTSATPIVYHSGLVPAPKDPDAPFRSKAYWGDTREQALSVLGQMDASLASMGLSFGDVVKMTVFLVGDPDLDGRMDFDGFMSAYTEYFGTAEQPNLPARSAVQVAGLANEGMLVEIEVQLARSSSRAAGAAPGSSP